MKRILLTLILITLLTACAPAATPAPTVDVAATVASISGTMVASTLTAQPSATPIPPTETPLPSETPTLVPPTATFTLEPPTATVTVAPFEGVFAPGNTEGLAKGIILIENLSGQEIVVTFEGITWTREQPVYYSWPVSKSMRGEIFWGRYIYRIVIGNKTTLTGDFQINNEDKTTFKVYKNKVAILGP